MKTGKTNKSITTLVWIHFLIVAFISTGFIGYTWIVSEFRQFEEESNHLRENFIDAQRALLKNELNNVLTFIQFKQSQTEARLRSTIRDRVYEAHSIVENIYHENAENIPDSEIKKLIKDALRNVRFNQGRGYYFIANLDGIEELYPIYPRFEGGNVLDLQDVNGNYVVRDEIELIRTQGEGFVTGYWRKPNADEEMSFPKMTFVKHIPQLNWYIGTGEYLDDVKNDIQEEVLEQIANMRFGKDGYLFVLTYSGDTLVMQGEPVSSPQNIWERTDSTGVKIVQELRKAVENPDGNFVQYSWSRLGDSKEEIPKMTYVKAFPDWKWIIGAGIYIDDIDTEIQKKRIALEDEIEHDIITILFILLSMLILVSVNAHYLAKSIRKHFHVFTAFFRQAATESIHIDKEQLHFSEFVSLANSANTMIKQREQVREALQIEKAYFEELFENLPESVVVLDNNSEILRINAEFTKLFGYTAKEAIGKSIDMLIAPEKMRTVAYNLTQKAWQDGKISVETVRRRKDGTLIDVSVLGVPIKEARQNLIYAIYRDITERKRSERKLQRLAITDSLTNIYNRLHINRSLEEEIELCRQYENSFSLIMFDIDHFKRINDTYGHHVGDDVLIEIITRVEQIIRESDIFARWGGEEFMILARNATESQAQILAERIRKCISEHSFKKVSRVTCSFGVTQFLPNDDAESVTKRVDDALYEAKASGRDKVVSK